MKEKITQFYDKYKKYLIFAVAVLILLIWFIHTPKKKVETPIPPTKTESISNIVSDTNLTKYIISQNEIKSLKSQIKSLNLKLETYQLENIQLKSQFKKTKNDEKNIKYFDYNSSIDSVLRSITRVTTKKPLPNRQQK